MVRYGDAADDPSNEQQAMRLAHTTQLTSYMHSFLTLSLLVVGRYCLGFVDLGGNPYGALPDER